jgi:predicted dehydrogenase
MNKANIAVMGAGAWGRNIVRTLADLGHLAAVCDPAKACLEAARKLVGEKAQRVRWTSCADEILADPEIAGVMVATPAETHYAMGKKVLAAGKDLFVEKPLTVDLKEAEKLVEAAEAAAKILMVGHLLEYHPAILKLHELIRSGELGEIRYVMSHRLNLGKIRTRENALWSFAPHDISVILRIAGKMPFEVISTGGAYVSPNIPDITLMQMLFDTGVRAHIYVSWLHPFKEQKLVVVGSKKMASFCDITKELILYDQRVEWRKGQPVPIKGDGQKVEFGKAEPLAEECRHFVECIRTRATPRTDGRKGLEILSLLHAAQKSLSTNGKQVLIN